MYDLFSSNSNFTYLSRKIFINKLSKEYPFLKVGLIGQSLCLRNIDVIKIGNPKKMNLWVAAHHGMEWITSAIVLKFLSEICEKIKLNKEVYGIDLEKCLEKTGLAIIPCLNPDGVEIALNGFKAAEKFAKFVKLSSKTPIFWQSNARGIDLNHNYNAGWNELHNLEIKNNITKPCATRFGGFKPHSEPETISLTNFCIKNNFLSAIAFHSQGEEIYWNYGDSTPKQSEKMASIFAFSSGYTLSKPEGLAVGGGFKDWFIKTFKKPAFTFEIGKGNNPLPLSDFESTYQKIRKMLYIALIN